VGPACGPGCGATDSLRHLTDHEWVHLTAEQLSADPTLATAIERFSAPAGRAGDLAAAWLKERALSEMSHIATYVLLMAGEIAGFYSLGMRAKSSYGQSSARSSPHGIRVKERR